MKVKTTRRAIMSGSENIRCAGYCDLKYLLYNHVPVAYNCGKYGWNFDVYEVYGLTICTGYRNMPGTRLENVSEFEEKAYIAFLKLYYDTREKKAEVIEALLKEFCKLNGGIV